MSKQWLSEKLEVKTSDPDEQRRGKMLNIFLLGMFGLSVIALIISLIFTLAGLPLGGSGTHIPAISMLFAAVIIFMINRSVSPTAASILFLFLFILIVWFSDEPYEIFWGRSMIMLTLPIIVASVILRPMASFVVVVVIAILIVFSALNYDFPINFVGTLVYFMVALVAWLAATTLEKALQEVRDINKALDVKVEERTKELVVANAQLAEARDEAIEVNQLKTELTARVSHEILTPLGGILGFAEMMFEGYFGPVNEKQQTKLTTIIETCQKLSDLVGDWLDQAKLESGKMELYNYWFAIRDAMKYVEGLTRVLIKEKPLVLSASVDTAVPHLLFGDEDRILQIITNLVTNAIKYTEEGTVHASVYLQEPNWIICVEDTGIGIPEKSLTTIFTSFSQVDGSRTRTQHGFGLGLSIVKQIVDLMEGEIQVESEVGVGSRFRVVLPIITDGKNPNEMPLTEEEIV